MARNETGLDTLEQYIQKRDRIVAAFGERIATHSGNSSIAIGGKKTSNLFRSREQGSIQRVAMGDLNKVISIDVSNRVAHVEGMTTYEELVKQTLVHGLMPTVVPELKTITIGGAVTGVGIEATSFRYGFSHETIEEMEILCGDGQVRTCRHDNEYRDLFYGFPNSYGTLGYALKLTVALIPVKPYVHVTHTQFSSSQEYFNALQQACMNARNGSAPADFIDGAVFGTDSYVLNVARFVDTAPKVSNYTYLGIYYKTMRTKSEDYLNVHDYIWRWDTDWFWCSRFFGVENKLVRLLMTPKLLRSTTYWKIRDWASSHAVNGFIDTISGRRESVIQDVEIPIERAAEYMEFFQQEIGIKPVWTCPTMAYKDETFDLFDTHNGQLYVNFGFWDSVPTTHEDGYYNRLIEKKVEELGGKKSLYSTSYYSEDEFWTLYNKPAYDKLKSTYDPHRIFKNLYQKCVKKG